VDLLRDLPPVQLAIFPLLWQVVDEQGQIDQEKFLARKLEWDVAEQQVQQYAEAVSQLRQEIYRCTAE
jgi:hypothetical protein